MPPYDCQVSVDPDVDALDCTAESFCNIWFMITGVRVSPRALAVMAGLKTPSNRRVINIINTVNSRGLVLYSDCPTPINFTMDSYYAPLNAQESKTFPVHVDLVPPDINVSPINAELDWGLQFPVPTRHMVAIVAPAVPVTESIYFDSELGAALKKVADTTTSGKGPATVSYQTSIKILKGARMLVFFQVKGNPTWWILGDGEWVGFSDMPALTSYVHGRPYTLSPIQLDQAEFNKIPANPDVFKS